MPQKVLWKTKRTRLAKMIFRKNKAQEFTFPDFKTYYKVKPL